MKRRCLECLRALNFNRVTLFNCASQKVWKIGGISTLHSLSSVRGIHLCGYLMEIGAATVASSNNSFNLFSGPLERIFRLIRIALYLTGVFKLIKSFLTFPLFIVYLPLFPIVYTFT